MPNRLELPDELNQLIEKREAERRSQEKDSEPAQSPSPTEAEEQRQGDRRKSEQ